MKVKIMSFISCVQFSIFSVYNSYDKYALISIQDANYDSGVKFKKTQNCKDVITLKFDDVIPIDLGRSMYQWKLMSEFQALSVINFIEKNKNVDYFVVHCMAGICRSSAVAKFILEYFGEDSSWIETATFDDTNEVKQFRYFPNDFVLYQLRDTHQKMEKRKERDLN